MDSVITFLTAVSLGSLFAYQGQRNKLSFLKRTTQQSNENLINNSTVPQPGPNSLQGKVLAPNDDNVATFVMN